MHVKTRIYRCKQSGEAIVDCFAASTYTNNKEDELDQVKYNVRARMNTIHRQNVLSIALENYTPQYLLLKENTN